MKKVGEIEVSEDLDFLRKEWRIQRVGWVGLLLFVLAGLSGLMGHGPYSGQRIGNADTLLLSYDRAIRHDAQTHLRLTIAPALSADTSVTLYISNRYLSDFNIENVIPEPQSSGVSGDFVYYEFLRADPRHTASITFGLKAKGYGSTRATIALRGGARLQFSQFVWP